MIDSPPPDARARARDLLKRHSGRTSPPGPPTRSDDAADLAATARFEEFPGYLEFCRQRDAFAQFGVRNPYFSAHEGVQAAMVRVADQEAPRSCASFSGYNYLDLAGHPQVIAAAVEAVHRYGTTVSASRVVSGEIPLHRQLERALADFLGHQEAVVFVSGYGTNVATLGYLFGPGDLILHDSLIHNSIMTGAKLSGARRMPFPHNDCAALERILADNRRQYRRTVVITEGVFSMDGDIAPLPELVAIKQRHQALLMVDEAHSLGVLGKTGAGLAEHFGMPADSIDIWMGTLSKSLASCGGVIAGRAALVDNLRLNAPGGILFSVGLTPANTGAALAALDVLRAEPGRVARLMDNSRSFAARVRALGLDTGTAAGTPVVPVILGNSLAALKVADRLFNEGVQVHPILYPAVPEEASRLRFFITAAHDETLLAQVAEQTAAAVAGTLAKVAP